MSHELVTLAEITCPKCHKFGCDCDDDHLPKVSSLAHLCPVCKRNKVVCICTSHASAPQSLADTPIDDAPALYLRAAKPREVEAVLLQIRHAYYDRDWVAVERIVRGLYVER